MRITVNIPDEIMKDLIKYLKAKSNSQAVKLAFKENASYKKKYNSSNLCEVS